MVFISSIFFSLPPSVFFLFNQSSFIFHFSIFFHVIRISLYLTLSFFSPSQIQPSILFILLYHFHLSSFFCIHSHKFLTIMIISLYIFSFYHQNKILSSALSSDGIRSCFLQSLLILIISFHFLHTIKTKPPSPAPFLRYLTQMVFFTLSFDTHNFSSYFLHTNKIKPFHCPFPEVAQMISSHFLHTKKINASFCPFLRLHKRLGCTTQWGRILWPCALMMCWFTALGLFSSWTTTQQDGWRGRWRPAW